MTGSPRDSMYQRALLALAKERRDDPPLRGGGVVRIVRDNPLCGDSAALSAQMQNDGVLLSQQTRGCILCEAAAALMIRLAADAAADDLRALCAAAEQMFDAPPPEPRFAIFAPVAAHPARHECVLLPFRALDDALRALRARS